jgi:uncharacterized protein YxeA
MTAQGNPGVTRTINYGTKNRFVQKKKNKAKKEKDSKPIKAGDENGEGQDVDEKENYEEEVQDVTVEISDR